MSIKKGTWNANAVANPAMKSRNDSASVVKLGADEAWDIDSAMTNIEHNATAKKLIINTLGKAAYTDAGADAAISTAVAAEAEDRADADTILRNDLDDLGDQVSGIESKIPDNASTSNQLATKSELPQNQTGKVGQIFTKTTNGGAWKDLAEKSGIKGDYYATWGWMEGDGGLPTIASGSNNIIIPAGIIMMCPGTDGYITFSSSTTFANELTEDFTVFYARNLDGTGATFLGVTDVVWSDTEPAPNGKSGFQAWKKSGSSNWQLRSNDTGNTWREVVGGPIGDVHYTGGNATRLDFDGYRQFNKQLYATKVDLTAKENTSNKVTTITSSSTNVQYPSAKAAKDYADKAAGLAGNPVGSIISYAGTTAPAGYLQCDGAAISRTTYANLFAVIGTTYGEGDGSTTFNLPDLSGARFVTSPDITNPTVYVGGVGDGNTRFGAHYGNNTGDISGTYYIIATTYSGNPAYVRGGQSASLGNDYDTQTYIESENQLSVAPEMLVCIKY